MTYNKKRRLLQKRTLAWTISALFLLIQPSVALGQRVRSPAPGTPLRNELLNALRQPLEKELSQAILFEVKTLNILGEWSFGELIPKRKDGKPIQYVYTPYVDAVESGMFDEGVCVLWYRQKEGWLIKTYVLGATDVPYGCWWKTFKAPKGIFPYTEKRCTD